MKLSDLAEKAASLPQSIATADWPGVEHWHDDVFKREVKTLGQAVDYINELRKRMATYSMALHDLGVAYAKMRAVLLALNIENVRRPRRRKP